MEAFPNHAIKYCKPSWPLSNPPIPFTYFISLASITMYMYYIYYLFILFILYHFPLEYKLQGNKDFCLFYSMLCSQCLEQ